MPGRVILLAAVALLAGCACKPEQVEVPTPVPVPGPTQYVPVPVELTADCPDRPATARNRMTGGELIATVKAWERWAACSDGQREAIRGLAAPQQ